MSDNPQYNMAAPMASWFDLEHFMDGLAIFNLPNEAERAEWPPAWTTAVDIDSMVEALKAAEKPHVADVEAAVALIALSGEVALEGFARETIRFLNVRASSVAWLAAQLVVKGSSMVPVPPTRMGDIVQWFLCDWWYEHGYLAWCDTWISEKWQNGRDND
jgi:hypothetical protein